MKLVVIESPYAGDVERNVTYARRAMADCLARGEAPIASHLLYTQPGILDDNKPEERALGIKAGLHWAGCANKAVYYMDYGLSAGMEKALTFYTEYGMDVEFRRIGENGQ